MNGRPGHRASPLRSSTSAAAPGRAHPEHPLDPALWSAVELQEAIDVAEFLVLLDSARQYGLVDGGPELDEQRCELIRAEARRRGVQPAPLDELVRRYIGEYS